METFGGRRPGEDDKEAIVGEGVVMEGGEVLGEESEEGESEARAS